MNGIFHSLVWFICFSVVWLIITYRSKKTEKEINKILEEPKMKFWGNTIGGCYFMSYLILIFYALHRLSIEHSGLLLLYRMAIYGTIISCIVEAMMFIISQKMRISINKIILSVAGEGKVSPYFIQFVRIIGPMLLFVYCIIYVCT